MAIDHRENQDDNEIKLGPRRWLKLREIRKLINLSINEPEFNRKNILLSLPKRNWISLALLALAILLRAMGWGSYWKINFIRVLLILFSLGCIHALVRSSINHFKFKGPDEMVFLRKNHHTENSYLWKYNSLFAWYASRFDGDWRSKVEFGLKWELFHWGTELITSLMALMIYEI